MPTRRSPARLTGLEEIAAGQAGAVSRRQALDLGLTKAQIESRLAGERWQRSGLPGVYVTFTGPMPYLTRVWAALLYAGDGATTCLVTAEWLWGLRDEPPGEVWVMVPERRRVVEQRGLRVVRCLRLDERRHPARLPPVTRLEDTVLDSVDRAAGPGRVIDIVIRACQRRRTTPVRLAAAAQRRKKLAWRSLVGDLVDDARNGVQSPLERHYRSDVERAHGLPRGRRNQPEGRPGRRRYRDVRYRNYALVVELDGRAAHPEDERDRDDLRDNALVEEEGTRTLRYGWRPVACRPCETAAQVGRVLQTGGWTGTLRRCGPDCTIEPPDAG